MLLEDAQPNGLYWMNRYIERAENMARLIDAGLRMSLTRSQDASEEWNSVLLSPGPATAFAEAQDYTAAERRRLPAARHVEPVERDVGDRDGAQQCPHGAHGADPRNLGEHQRSLDVAEASCWQARSTSANCRRARRHQARDGTDPRLVLRHHAAQRDLRFRPLGTYVERADNTSAHPRRQILRAAAVVSWVGSSLDNYQWESILRSVAAHRSYRWVYEAEYKPTNIADYLILNAACRGRCPSAIVFLPST
jgi:uncharacterized alpha-E superfamily protein